MGNDSVDLLVKLAMEAKEYGKKLKTTSSATAKWAKGIAGSVASFGGAAVVAGVAAVGAAVAGIGIASVDMASQIKQSQKDLRAELGVTAEEAERLGDVATKVFANNFYDSVGDAAGAVAEVRKQLGDLNDEEMQDAAENAARISDTFDQDVGDSLNAVKVLTEEFGISQQEAFDLITTGFQRGLNSSDDFLDSITEYGNLFAEGGAGADEFFSILETGLKGGVLGTDKAADAFKEFSIRIIDDSDSTNEALGKLFGTFDSDVDFGNLDDELQEFVDMINRDTPGAIDELKDLIAQGESFDNIKMDWADESWDSLKRLFDQAEVTKGGVDEFMSSITSGDISGTEAMDQVIAKLAEIEDPIERNKQGVALFGTQWEDLGESAILGLSSTKTSLEETAGATDTLNAKYENIGSMLEGLKRQGLVAFAPIGDAILKLANDAMPFLQEAMTKAQPIIESFAETFSDTLGPAMEIIKDSIERIFTAFTGSNEQIEFMDILMATLTVTLDVIITAVEATAVVFHLLAVSVEAIAKFVRYATAEFNKLGNSINNLGDKLPDWLTPGSPTPLELGIKGIGAAIKQMPQLDFQANANMGNIAAVGAGAGGSGVSFGDINISGGNVDVDEATRQFASLLRGKLKDNQ